MALANAKHEKFAQELASGKTATEAYVTAGYKESRPAASRLSTNVNVVARIAEIKNAGAIRVEVTIASLIQEAAEIQSAAKESGQHSAAIAALTAKAKLAGLWIDKSDNTNRNADPARVSDAELAAVIEADSGERAAASAPDSRQLN